MSANLAKKNFLPSLPLSSTLLLAYSYVSRRHGGVGGEPWYGFVEVVEVHLHRGGQERRGCQVQHAGHKVERHLQYTESITNCGLFRNRKFT